jgi:LysM repeat protein
MRRASATLIAAIATVVCVDIVQAQSLRGSPVTMARQNRVAQDHDFTFLQTSAQVQRFVSSGYLVRVPGNANYELASVSHPYARPAVKTFIERLSAQYRSACGEKLVVTSLTRPVREQPRNASDLSVHPAGMAVDLRVSNKRACVRWLESTLLSLEKQGVLDATRERRPPHYHVALFPQPYTRYVASLTSSASRVAAAETKAKEAVTVAVSVPVPEPTTSSDRLLVTANVAPDDEPVTDTQAYRVNRGDTLWSIARRLGTTVDALKDLNGLKGSQLRAGQTLTVPVVMAGADDS